MSGMSHRYKAVIKFFKSIAAVKQTIGMVYQIAFPKECENALSIVEHWKKEDPGFGALIHTPRETATYFVLNVNSISEPHVDPSDSESTFTAMHVWGDFDVENGGHFALPIFNRSYKMERDSMLFLKASLVRHHVTRWKGMLGQRFSAVHITQDNMANFRDMVEPPTPAQKKEWQNAYKTEDTVKECPFCKAKMRGSSAVNGHLSKIIEKGGDELHDLEATKKWSDDKKKETLAARRARSNKRKADALENAGGADNREGDEDNDEKNDQKLQQQVEKTPKAKKAKRGKTLKFSDKYEQFGKEVYDENEKGAVEKSRG
ncbi:hypothetical protein N431DRAFT_427867 [Stipitochalara longipes BDJ]|nr:hypothetical protein N431DRAFT_427867 [Stipitochalara longipes BDJ]